MSEEVIIKRFVNTPTLDALHQQEFGESELMEMYGEPLQELSDEYDTVSGNEALYKKIFAYVHANSGYTPITGNESFGGSVVKGIEKVLNFFKSIFKAIWNFFNNSNRITEDKLKNITFKEYDNKEGKTSTYSPQIVNLIPKGSPDLSNLKWLEIVLIKYKDDVSVFKSLVGGISKSIGDIKDLIDKAVDDPDSFTKMGFRRAVEENCEKVLQDIIKSEICIFGSSVRVNEFGELREEGVKNKVDLSAGYVTNKGELQSILRIADEVNNGMFDCAKVVTAIDKVVEKVIRNTGVIKNDEITLSVLKTIQSVANGHITLLQDIILRGNKNISLVARILENEGK